MDPDLHGSRTFAWIRNSENSKFIDPDPEEIIPDPQHCLKHIKDQKTVTGFNTEYAKYRQNVALLLIFTAKTHGDLPAEATSEEVL